MDVNVNSSSLPRLIDARAVSGALTDSNKLDQLLLRKPFQFGQVVSYLLGKQYGHSLQCLTEALGRIEEKEIDSNIYQWDVAYMNDRTIKITAGPTTVVANAGLNCTPVQLTLEEKWFSGIDKVRTDTGALVNIIADPIQTGNGWLYTFQFSDPAQYFDPNDIITGAKLSRAYSPVSEMSDRGGWVDFFSPAKFENYFTTHRIEHAISAEAMKQKIAIELTKSDGSKTFSWIEKAKWEAMAQLLKREEIALMYGTMSKGNVLGPNGRPIIEGAGLRQQISNRNKQTYNRLSYDMLQDYLMNLSWIANGQSGGDFKFVMMTGRQGMIEFDRAIQDKVRNLSIKVYEGGQFVSGTGMNMSFGSQFKTCMFPNGLEVTVVHCPLYDDIVLNRQLDPATGYPLESSRFTIFNIGNNANGANLVKVTLKGAQMGSIQIEGMTDINGNYKQGFAPSSSALDGAQIHMIRRSGILLKDPLSAGELIPAKIGKFV